MFGVQAAAWAQACSQNQHAFLSGHSRQGKLELLRAIASRLKAIGVRLEAIAISLEVIASRLEG